MFKNKVVAITGAGSGIGRALSIELAARGARLALSDVNETTLAETMRLLPQGVEARAYPLDVSSREAVFQFADDVLRDFGGAHFVINNAGTSIIATFERVTLEETERVLAINLWGVIYGTKAFLPIMLRQKEGCIVNISSVLGLVAQHSQPAYTISKFGVRGLTETLWQELEGTGVRAVLVHPGGINTNISKNTPEAKFATEMERRVAQGSSRILTTPPEDCARQIVEGLVRGDKRLMVGSGARRLYWVSRLLPNSYGRLVRRAIGI